LPSISYKPQAFACFPFTGCGDKGVGFPQNQAIGSSTGFGVSQSIEALVPLYVEVVVPARAAYSHSASVGSRYPVQDGPLSVTPLQWNVLSAVPGRPAHPVNV
jgi:hypothetical protein